MTTFAQETLDGVADTLSDRCGWHYESLLRKQFGYSRAKMQSLLATLMERGIVERKYVAPEPGGIYRQAMWRVVPDPSTEPLYAPAPGWDARALADCWEGYTFRNCDTMRSSIIKERPWQH